MHTGIISFCDRIGFNIKCTDVKETILNQLEHFYKIRIIQKHWFAFDESQVSYVQKIPHLASIRSNGNPYYIYFTQYEGVNQMMYIDKKIQPGYQKPRIILSKGQFHDEIFQNTLIEGEMVKDKRKQWLFLINDVIIYKGKSLFEKQLPERLDAAYELLENHYVPDTIMDVCQFQVKKYVPATQKGVNCLLEFSEKLPYTSRGIYFYPYYLKYKPKLINFDENLIKSVIRKVKDTAGYIESSSAPLVATKSASPTLASPPSEETSSAPVVTPATLPLPNFSSDTVELWLRKTDQPDVYELFPMDNSTQKMGIAAVPGLQTSKMLRNVFKNLNVATSVKFICQLDPAFNNWVPLQKA